MSDVTYACTVAEYMYPPISREFAGVYVSQNMHMHMHGLPASAGSFNKMHAHRMEPMPWLSGVARVRFVHELPLHAWNN